MVTRQQSERSAAVLAFFDWSGELDQNEWLSTCIDFFELIGAIPNAARYLTQAKYNSGIYKGASVKPNRLREMFKITDINAASVIELRPPGNDILNWRAAVDFSRGDNRKKYASFAYETTTIDVDLFVGLTQRFSKVASITYGTGFLRPFRLGPGMYVADIIYGLDRARPEDAVEIQQMAAWYRERLDMTSQDLRAPFRHLEGMLKDVYPFNVLTARHLNRDIDGIPLLEWVLQGERGVLEEVSDGVWVWIVPDHSLVHVREQLCRSGLLITRTLDKP